jgi:hypothetical protein
MKVNLNNCLLINYENILNGKPIQSNRTRNNRSVSIYITNNNNNTINDIFMTARQSNQDKNKNFIEVKYAEEYKHLKAEIRNEKSRVDKVYNKIYNIKRPINRAGSMIINDNVIRKKNLNYVK